MLLKVSSNTARNFFYFKGSRLFNDIPNEWKDINSVKICKTRISEFYRSQAFLLFLELVAVLRLFRFLFFAGPLLISAFFVEEVTLVK